MKKFHCLSCQSEVEALPCLRCGWAESPRTSVMFRPVGPPKILPEVHACVVVDATGSTSPFRAGVEKTVEQILAPVAARCPWLSVTVVVSRDLEYGEPCVVLCEGVPLEEAVKDLKSIKFGGGGDALETHLDGVDFAVANAPWLGDVRRGRDVLLVLTSSDTKPLRNDVPTAVLVEELRRRAIISVFVSSPAPVLEAACEDMGGVWLTLSNSPSVEECRRVAAMAAESIQKSVSSAPTRPATDATAITA